jgi:uncharacterized membrane protein YciS (DUF1049 family)
MGKVDVGVLGVGAIVAIPLIAGAWKAGTLRADIVEKFQSRHDTALVGLETMAARLLSTLAADYSQAIGGIAQDASASVAFDPSKMKPGVDSLAKVLKAHDRMPSYLTILLRVGPFLSAFLIGAFLSLLVAVAYLSGWDHLRISSVLSLLACCGFLAAAAVDALIYVITLQFFTNAELLPSRGTQT